jgi:hypothetical protein
MIATLLSDLEAAKSRTEAKIEALASEKLSLQGRLDGINLSIQLASIRLKEEQEAASEPVYLEDVDFSQSYLALVGSQSDSKARESETGNESSESLSGLSGAFSRHSEGVPRVRRRRTR